MARVQISVRIDKEVYDILKAIESEYGINLSTVVRIALSWFVPRFYLTLKKLELNEILKLEERIERLLREGLGGGAYHT